MQKEKRLVPKLRFSEFDGEWKNQNLKEILTIGSGKDYKHLESGEIPVYGSGGLMRYVNDYLYDGYSIGIGRKGTIDKPIFLTGKFWTVDTLFYTHSFIKSDIKFIYNQFQRINWKKYNEAGGVPSLSKKTIEQIQIKSPSHPEQQKIANFLTSIDTQIQTLEKKKSLLEQYKKGVMQKIFKQELRFKDDDGNVFPKWAEKKIGDLIIEYKKKSSVNNEYPVLTSSKRGLMLQSEYYSSNNPISERDNLGFNVLPEDYITYRSRSDNRSFNFNFNSLGFTGIISIYYPVFKVEKCNNYFLITLLNHYKSKIGKYSVGTSQTVLSLNELKKMKFFVPSLPEQTKIANFLSAIDKNIALVSTKIEHTKAYKKGLLQQMFV